MQRRGVDAEQVMEEVNRAVAAPDTLLADFWSRKGAQAPNLAFIYPPYSKTLLVNLDLVSRNWEIEPEFELGSRRRAVGGLVISFKRLTRSLLRWYINPIVHQVRKFNMLVTRTLHDLANNLDELSQRVERLERHEDRLADLSERVERLEGDGKGPS
ncbi:MAG: hypothetical protein KKF41_01760 [Actinobacteria bacterium]|nr:hypothetical protein [Actinomycetota bacterium]MBU1942420.1 hypothetical protein [Actinomycetota bacterium]MBU2686292.1 hypothetical protein [Actinomycetota bacterium]